MRDSLRELWQFRPLIMEMVRRDLKLRYKNSIGGLAWSLLNPLMQIAVITVVMKFLLANPVKNYSAHLFILFTWNFFQLCLVDGCISVLQNAPLVRKVYFPRAILPLATVLANAFHFSIAFIFTLVYLFILGAYPQNLRWEFLMVLPTLFALFALCLGMSYILSYLNVFYEDVRFIITALMSLFFYAMPILYPIENVRAHPEIYKFYMLNPVAALLVTYQRALLPPPEVRGANNQLLPAVGIPWNYFSLAFVSSCLILLLGFYLFERNKWDMVEKL